MELKGEREVLEAMRGHYEAALGRVNAKIEALAERDDLSGIRQRRFQEALAEQIGGALDELRGSAHATLEAYLRDSYEDGFVGSLYSLQKQGIPLAFPIDQASVARAASMTAGDVKLSRRVYSNVGKLQKQVVAEITRGFADAESATAVAGRIAQGTDIATCIKRNVKGRTDQAFRRSMTIARTEKGRVTASGRLDAMRKAKEAGADVVKQWDSTLDSRTRPDHVAVDGQIREIDEPFSVGGCKGLAPHMLGRPEQDVNCRCAVLQRSRTEFEVPEEAAYTKWNGTSQCIVDLSDSENYGEFRRRYEALAKSAASRTASASASRTYETDLHRLPREAVAAEAEKLGRGVATAWTAYKAAKSATGYENAMGAYLDGLSGDGFLSAEHGVKPEGKEVQLAAWLAAKGHDVRLLHASSVPGDRTPDMLLDGEPWEMKRVTSSKVSKLKERIDEASRQSPNVIVDLSLSAIDQDEAARAVAEMLEDVRIARILVVRDGEAAMFEE